MGQILKKNRKYRIMLVLCSGLILAAAAAFFHFYSGFPIPLVCAWYEITGLYCPGCGAGRACRAFLQFHFVEALPVFCSQNNRLDGNGRKSYRQKNQCQTADSNIDSCTCLRSNQKYSFLSFCFAGAGRPGGDTSLKRKPVLLFRQISKAGFYNGVPAAHVSIRFVLL